MGQVRMPMGAPYLVAQLVLALSVVLPLGCRAADPAAPATGSASHAAPGPALGWPVAPPPPLQGADPPLWVALAARLGPTSPQAVAAARPLLLRSDQGPLRLMDARGQRFMAPSLSLRWTWQPLARPLELRRAVLGPFASFEAAEQVALRWRALGVPAQVAHPRAWEVWAPADAPPPAGMVPRLEQRHLEGRSQLVLRRPEGDVVLEAPLRLEAPGGLRWGGGLFAGPFRIQPDAYGSWTLVEQVPLERYLAGVVPHEIGAAAPAAALQAQAVLARTWAVRNRHRFALDGYHLCADTQCQVYGDPRSAGAAVRQAIAATAGQVLSWQGEPIHAVYHASNGGVAADEDEAWPLPELPYLEPALEPAGQERTTLNGAAPVPGGALAGVTLPIQTAQELQRLLAVRSSLPGADHPLFRWQRLLDQASLREGLGQRAGSLGAPLAPVVLERGASGRVVRLAIRGPAGQVVLERDAIRRAYRQLPSTLFVLEPLADGRWRVVGGGFGHGAGLSQAGAIALARRGWSLGRILERYYPGARLEPIPALSGQAP